MRHKLQRVRPILKKHVVPHIFDCQKKVVKPPALSTVRVQKRKRKEMVNELLKSSGDVAAPDAFLDIPVPNADLDVPVHPHGTMNIPPVPMSLAPRPIELTLNKSTQVNPRRKRFKSRGTNPLKTPKLVDKACSTMEFDGGPVQKNVQSEDSDETSSPVETSDEEYVLPTDSENDVELDEESQRDWLKATMRKCFLLSIERNPKLFLGLPPQCYLTITFLSKKVNCSTPNIMIALKKMKLNDSFEILGHHFGLSSSSICRIFADTIYYMAVVLQDFIFWPDQASIQQNLPISFRARYSKVCSIIDCFEIKIEKPSNPLHQSMTWSSYYSCNTLKYLISCTPDGLVSYISEGYGGRVSDTAIVEDSGYVDKVPCNSQVMADRGFKHVSALLLQRGSVLVRPPSVIEDEPLSKEESKEAKRIAALRIHVERVIGRLREFQLLAKTNCIDNHFVAEFDKVVIVACGLINLQAKIIKY